MSKNEKKTENLSRRLLTKAGMFDNDDFIVEEQRSDNPMIQKLLQNASKSGLGVGKPEFIISKKSDDEFLIVIECKADTKKHISKTGDEYKDYAVDGVLLYASHLSRAKTIIAIAISGEAEDDVHISTYLYPKNASTCTKLLDENHQMLTKVERWERYVERATYDPVLTSSRRTDLMKFSRELHEYLRDYAKVTEAQKPLLVSGILLALMEEGFEVAYKKYEGEDLAEKTFQAIKYVVDRAQLGANQESKKRAVINAFSFIEHHPELHKVDVKKNQSPLKHIIAELHLHVQPFTKDRYDFDIIGNFYGEFIRYTGGDKQGLGIVLTPNHISDLFADLAKVTKNSVVLDICAGTGGFLISAMKKMTEHADVNEKRKILENSLIGVEQEPSMFALAVSNMILRGDGKTNLYQGDSLKDVAIIDKIKGKADTGFINPPYSQKGEDVSEWHFIIEMLDLLSTKGTGIAIVPMALAIDTKNPMREKLLKNHRLEAVMSMPDDLFYPVGVVTCIMVFTAHVPHDSDPHHESWFGYWKDDGFRKDRVQGRVPHKKEHWEKVKSDWLADFSNKKVIPGVSVRRKVLIADEWCAEAYLETDYTKLESSDFTENIKKYIAFKLCNNQNENQFNITTAPLISENKSLDIKKWKSFDYETTSEESVFIIKKGKRLVVSGQNRGTIPYISSSSYNNGLDNLIDNGFTDSNCLSFACYGSIGEVFYQKGECWISDNCNAIYIKDRPLNVYVAMFLVTLLRLEQFRFSYGMTAKKERLQSFKISLPIDKSGNPDWKYMEEYIKSLPYSASI